MSRTLEQSAHSSLRAVMDAGNLKTHWDINKNGENVLHLLCRALNEKAHVKSSMIHAITKLASNHHFFCWMPDAVGLTPIYILLERGALTPRLFNCFVRDVHDCGRMVNTNTGETLVGYAIRTRCLELVEHVRSRFMHGVFCAKLACPGTACPYSIAVKHGFDVKVDDYGFCCEAALRRPYCFDVYMGMRQRYNQLDAFERAILDNRLLFLINKCPRRALEARSIQYMTLNVESSSSMFTSLAAMAPFELTPNMSPSPVSSIMFGGDEIVSGLRREMSFRHWSILVKQLERVVRQVGEFIVFILDGYSEDDNEHVEMLIDRAPPLFRFVVANGTRMMPQFDMSSIAAEQVNGRTERNERSSFLKELETTAREQLLAQKRAVDVVMSPLSGCGSLLTSGLFFLTKSRDFAIAQNCFERALCKFDTSVEYDITRADVNVLCAFLKLVRMRSVQPDSIMCIRDFEQVAELLNTARRLLNERGGAITWDAFNLVSALHLSQMRFIEPIFEPEVKPAHGLYTGQTDYKNLADQIRIENVDCELDRLRQVGRNALFSVFLLHMRRSTSKTNSWNALIEFERALLTSEPSENQSFLLTWPSDRCDCAFDVWRVAFSRALLFGYVDFFVRDELAPMSDVAKLLGGEIWPAIEAEWDSCYPYYAECLGLDQFKFPKYWSSQDHVVSINQRSESLKMFVLALAALRISDMADKHEYAGCILYIMGLNARPTCRPKIFSEAIEQFYAAYGTFNHETIALVYFKLALCYATSDASRLAAYFSISLNIIDRVRTNWFCFFRLRAMVHLALAKVYRPPSPLRVFARKRRSFHIDSARKIIQVGFASNEHTTELGDLLSVELQVV